MQQHLRLSHCHNYCIERPGNEGTERGGGEQHHACPLPNINESFPGLNEVFSKFYTC